MFASEIIVQSRSLSQSGEIAAANVIPSLLAPKPTEDESDRAEATAKKGKSKGQ